MMKRMNAIIRQKNPVTGRMEWTETSNAAYSHVSTTALATISGRMKGHGWKKLPKDVKEQTLYVLRQLSSATKPLKGKAASKSNIWFDKLLEADTDEKLLAIANWIEKDPHAGTYQSKTGLTNTVFRSGGGVQYGARPQIVVWTTILQNIKAMIQYDYAKKKYPNVKYLTRGWSTSDSYEMLGREEPLTLEDYVGRARKERYTNHPQFMVEKYCSLKEGLSPLTSSMSTGYHSTSRYVLKDDEGKAHIPNGTGYGSMRGKMTKAFGEAYRTQIEVTDYIPNWDLQLLDTLLRRINLTHSYLNWKAWLVSENSLKNTLKRSKVTKEKKAKVIEEAVRKLEAVESTARRNLENTKAKTDAFKKEYEAYVEG